MTLILNKFIGKSKKEIIEFCEINNLKVNFSISMGKKDLNILNEEYAIRAKYVNGILHVVLAYFKTLI